MISKASILVLFVLLNVNKIYLQEESNEYVKITSEIDLVVWDLEDRCSENAKSYRYLLSGKPNGLKNMIEFEIELGQYLREYSTSLLKLTDTIPQDLERNFTLLTKSGDYLLSEEDWKMLNSFAYKNEDLQINQVVILNETELHKSDYEEILQASKDIDELETTWTVWQQHISKYQSDFPEVLKLVNKAAKQNDLYNAKSYWDKMSDYDDLYSKVVALWEEIEPLYRKLQQFVGRRLNHYYGTNYTGFIPAYLLGSNQGEDWSNIADIILPHPQLLYDINHNLLQKDIIEVYKIAENTTVMLNLGKLGRNFWKQSDFNMKDCDSHVLTYCSQKMSHLLTCANTSYPHFLAAHSAALKVTLDRLDYSAYAHLLRPTSTAITEAILALGDIFALANLERHGVLAEGTFSEGDDEASAEKAKVNKMNAMLLLALRVFPRLVYTYEMDAWRLGALEDKDGDVGKKYWEIRKKFSGIEGVTNEEATYLNDINILRNKPYINKFIGTILQFQILNHYQMDIFDESTDIVRTIGGDSSTFITMLQERSSRNVPDLLNYHYSIDDISAYPLTEFFSPLFEYLETVPIEQGKVVPKVRTTSTTTTTTTTTTTSTTTKKPVVKEQPKQDHNLLKDAPAAPEKPEPPVKNIKTAQVLSGDKSKAAESSENSSDTGMIAIIVVIVTLSVCMVAALLWKKYKRKPHTNNRRFET